MTKISVSFREISKLDFLFYFSLLGVQIRDVSIARCIYIQKLPPEVTSWSHLPIYQEVRARWHSYLSVSLNCFNWALLTPLVRHKINKHYWVCLAFSFGIQRVTSETKTSSYTWHSQVAKHTVFHSENSVLIPIFVGSNVQMILIYSEDVLNFLS